MSLRKAINNKCRECIYDPYQKGSWLMQVSECTSPCCPLYSVRPRSKVFASKTREDGSKVCEIQDNAHTPTLLKKKGRFGPLDDHKNEGRR